MKQFPTLQYNDDNNSDSNEQNYSSEDCYSCQYHQHAAAAAVTCFACSQQHRLCNGSTACCCLAETCITSSRWLALNTENYQKRHNGGFQQFSLFSVTHLLVIFQFYINLPKTLTVIQNINSLWKFSAVFGKFLVFSATDHNCCMQTKQ